MVPPLPPKGMFMSEFLEPMKETLFENRVSADVITLRILRWHLFPGKSTGAGCHFLLHGIFPTQGSNPRLLRLLYWQAGFLYHWHHLGSSSCMANFFSLPGSLLQCHLFRGPPWSDREVTPHLVTILCHHHPIMFSIVLATLSNSPAYLFVNVWTSVCTPAPYIWCLLYIHIGHHAWPR